MIPEKKPTLTEANYRTLFYMLLKQIGGMGIKGSHLRDYPLRHDCRWEARHDSRKDVWEIYIPKESSPKKGIIARTKKLILPGR